MTREYPPQVYGGAGVHVEYLSRELAKLIEVEVHCWGTQRSDDGNLHVIGDEPRAEVTAGTEAKFKTAVDALSAESVADEGTRRRSTSCTRTRGTRRWPDSWRRSSTTFRFVLDDARAGAAARVEGGAAGLGLRDELVDGADGDPRRGCDHRGLAWNQGRTSCARIPKSSRRRCT